MGNESNQKNWDLYTQWKDLYLKAVMQTLHPRGDVLEIGFGSGYAANLIQGYQPKSHTIIESHQTLIPDSIRWLSEHKNSAVISKNWREALPELGQFDTIFYHDYTLQEEVELVHHLFPEEVDKIAEEAKKTLELLHKEISRSTVKYSDKDIEDFYNGIGQGNIEHLPDFFRRLMENNNITKEQYNKVMEHLRHAQVKAESLKNVKREDELFEVLRECILQHLRKGGRFSCLLNNQTSRYQDSQFFETIISSPEIDYKETTVPLSIGDIKRDALIMIVEKMS